MACSVFSASGLFLFSLACLPFYYAGISHDLAEGISVAAVSGVVDLKE
jgi:hypothetical protein